MPWFFIFIRQTKNVPNLSYFWKPFWYSAATIDYFKCRIGSKIISLKKCMEWKPHKKPNNLKQEAKINLCNNIFKISSFMFVLQDYKAFQLTNQYFCIIRRTFILLSLFCEQTWSKYWTKYWQVYLVSQSNGSSVLQLRTLMILCAHVTILNYAMLCKFSSEIYFW